MESTRPSLGPQKTSSFNPEATAFNPNITSAPNPSAVHAHFEHVAHEESTSKLTERPPELIAHPRVPGPDSSAVDMSELNASLGLSGRTPMAQVPPTYLRASRPMPGLSGAYGKLIDRALERPLTADDLANILNTTPGPLHGAVTAPSLGQGLGMASNLQGQGVERGTKTCYPPPGMGHLAPREIPDEDTSYVTGYGPEMKHIPTAPRVFQVLQHADQYQTATSGRQSSQYAYMPLKRRQRTATRTRRTDQGPEPSPADIYPADANWGTPYKPFDAIDKLQSHLSSASQLPKPGSFHPGNSAGWPNLAEASQRATHEQSRVSYYQLPSSAFANHVCPTAADINAADAEVLAIIDEPVEMVDMLFDSGLMTGESDGALGTLLPGNKYGLNYYGIGLGDSWNPPMPAGSERIRW